MKAKKKYARTGNLTKEQQYPNIKWLDLHDTKVQQATILFNDRINTFRIMKVLDADLDNNPNTKDIKELAELRIRNHDCFRELEALNETGDFVYKTHHNSPIQPACQARTA